MGSNWSEHQKIRTEVKEKNKARKEKLAGYFFDLSKVSFAGLVIGIIIPLLSNMKDYSTWFAAVFGLMLTVILALIANKILK